MLSSPKIHSPQLGMFSGLADQLDQKHPLFLLAHKINWHVFEDAFKVHYSEKMGKPAKPIRLMAALLILKYVRNLSDESLAEQWGRKPLLPIPERRASLPACELKESIRVNEPPEGGPPTVLSVDTTVQEKNITYPTDDKLYKKIIRKCRKIADKEGIDLQQTYTRTVKKLSA